MKRLLMLVLVAILLIAAFMLVIPVAAAPPGVTAVAQDPAPVQIPTLLDALRLLATTGGVGVVISFLLTRVPTFQTLSGQVKFWIVFGISMLVPIGAQAIVQNVQPEVLAKLEPYWQALAGGFMAFLGSQIAFKTLYAPSASPGPQKK